MPVLVFEGELGPITDIVTKHAKIPDFLKYGEDMKATLVAPRNIIPHKDMWIELRAIHKRFTWSQSDMVEVFKEVANRNGTATWPRQLNNDELKDFSIRMAKRFRVMVRHINQAMVKKNSWATTMLKDEASGVPDEDQLARKRPASAMREYTYGYDHVTGKAFRECNGKRNFTDIIIGDDDDGNPSAIFMEGDTAQTIMGLTNGELRDRRAVGLSARGSIWEGTTTTGERLRVAKL